MRSKSSLSGKSAFLSVLLVAICRGIGDQQSGHAELPERPVIGTCSEWQIFGEHVADDGDGAAVHGRTHLLE